MIIFEKNVLDNKTSRDLGRVCANEKRKRCKWISSDRTLGRNYPPAGYNY